MSWLKSNWKPLLIGMGIAAGLLRWLSSSKPSLAGKILGLSIEG